MREGIIDKPVYALQVGDVLFPTEHTITHVPYTSVRAGAGKMVVEYITKNGIRRSGIWGRHTKIGVIAR